MNEELLEELALYADDPYGFVMFAFPWGEPGTDLEHIYGPEPWQRELLEQIGKGLLPPTELLGRLLKQLHGRTSGHGIGKSAEIAWLILWCISTYEDARGVVTANTENQLKTKTWVELAKWHRMFIGKDLFKLTATALFSVDPAHHTTWRMDMVPWSERNTEAFAGLHNQDKRIALFMDEASAIPDLIWEVSEGALTDKNTEIFWFAFGNPTRNKGRFRECFEGGKFAHRWSTKAIDSREVSLTDKQQIQEWIDDYGDDSDFVRVRVKGQFPRIDAESFISFDLASQATQRTVVRNTSLPVVLGVDVARFGDDASVIYPRQGRDGVSRPIEVYFGLDTVQLAHRVMRAFHKHGASLIFVDEGGVGGGVVDQLRVFRLPVVGVDFGSAPDEVNEETGVKYANKRAEIWGAMRTWLERGSIPYSVPGLARLDGSQITLVDELIGPNFGLTDKEKIKLESKKDMRRRGLPSPNVADALACTFAYPEFEPKPRPVDNPWADDQRPEQYADYNPLDPARVSRELH